MINAYKGRQLIKGARVEVYRNLHNGLFSVRDSKSRLVVAHGEWFVVGAAELRVSETGRARVIREQQKNVHAWVVGSYMGESGGKIERNEEVTYNPYEKGEFYGKDSGKVYTGGKFLFGKGKMYALK